MTVSSTGQETAGFEDARSHLANQRGTARARLWLERWWWRSHWRRWKREGMMEGMRCWNEMGAGERLAQLPEMNFNKIMILIIMILRCHCYVLPYVCSDEHCNKSEDHFTS